MPPLVETLIEEARWRDFGIEGLAESAARATLSALGMRPEDWQIGLLACNDARIAELNADFRDKASATNVLSWPSDERGAGQDGAMPAIPDPSEGRAAIAQDPELGDIAIAYETCMKEADQQQKTAQAHVTHLLVHGVLHLLGYDHIRDRDADLMEKQEVEILASLGVADPYVRRGA